MSLKCNISCWMRILLLAAGTDQLAQVLFAQQVHPQQQIGSVILADVEKFNRADWASDPYFFQTANIDGDTLQLTVSYSGGCKEHEFKLVAWNYFLESNPVQAHVLLAHNANGDLCRGWITEVLHFDLSPLKQVYQQLYSDAGPLIVNLRDLSRDDGSLLYNFSMGKANPQIVQVGVPFEIAVGEASVLEPEGLQIEFESVKNDSRCPKDVVCVWEGMAEIQLRLTAASGESTPSRLTIPGLVSTPYTLGNAVEQYGYQLQLLQLSPYPHADQPQPPDDGYRAMLLVEDGVVSVVDARNRMLTTWGGLKVRY